MHDRATRITTEFRRSSYEKLRMLYGVTQSVLLHEAPVSLRIYTNQNKDIAKQLDKRKEERL